MPHRRLDLQAFARRLSPRVIFAAMLLLTVTACGSDSPSTTVVVIDSTAAHDTLEVIVLPIDPATLAATPLADDADARLALALHDSVETVDARFQRLRDTLNAESRDMQNADRRSPGYHRRFDDWRRRMLVADSLRRSRDRLGARASKSALPSGDAKSTVRATLLAAAAHDGRRAMLRRVAGGDSVALDLARGDWWIGVARASASPRRWARARAGRIALRL